MPKHVVSIHLRVPTLNLPICRPNDFQVQTKAGEYVDATPIPDTIVVNVGDIMQRWTADRLVSTVCTSFLQLEELKKKLIKWEVSRAV